MFFISILWLASFFAGKLVCRYSTAESSTPFNAMIEDRIEGIFCFFASLAPHIILATIIAFCAELHALVWAGAVLISVLSFCWPIWSRYKRFSTTIAVLKQEPTS